jgi:predicted RND superfamily exporter protein
VGLVLGVMGWSGIPLDVATVMTASVAFGVAVDDTFHYLYHWRRGRSIGLAARVAGQGIVATSFVVAGGFSVLALSGFTPVVRFGLLTALAVALALLVDAVLLPALVGRRDEVIDAKPDQAAGAGAAGLLRRGDRRSTERVR